MKPGFVIDPRMTPAAGRRAGHWTVARLLGTLAFMMLPAVAAGGEVTADVDPAEHTCAVHGWFHVTLPPSAAWSVVADYDHIPDFVRSMLSSHAERRPDGRLFVAQIARGGFFLFHRRVRVLLEIDEEPGQRIRFRDVLGKDFERYAGEWRLEPDSSGTVVRYSLDAEPRSAIPRSLCRRVLRRTAADLLVQVRDEIVRRAAARP